MVKKRACLRVVSEHRIRSLLSVLAACMKTNSLVRSLLVVVLVVSHLPGARVEMQGPAAVGQKLNGDGEAALQRIIDSAHHPDLRWPDFPPYQAEVKEFYTRTGSTLGWVRDRKPTPQAVAMIALFTGV